MSWDCAAWGVAAGPQMPSRRSEGRMSVSCPCTRVLMAEVWSGPRTAQMQTEVSLCQQQALGPGLCFLQDGQPAEPSGLRAGSWGGARATDVTAETAVTRSKEEGDTERSLGVTTGLHAWGSTLAEQPGQQWVLQRRQP